MSQVNITLPDGSSRTVPAGSPVRDVAAGISPGLAKAALAAGYLAHCGRMGVATARRLAPAATIFALVTAAATSR